MFDDVSAIKHFVRGKIMFCGIFLLFINFKFHNIYEDRYTLERNSTHQIEGLDYEFNMKRHKLMTRVHIMSVTYKRPYLHFIPRKRTEHTSIIPSFKLKFGQIYYTNVNYGK